MQIVSLVPEGAPSSLYRSFIPMQALALGGHRVHVEERNGLGDPRALRGVDVVHVFRLCGRAVEQFAGALRAQGTAVVWDNDFDLAAAPADHPVGVAARGMAAQRWRADERRIVRLVDLVTAPTEELAGRHRAAGARATAVVENLLPPTFQRPRTLPERGLTIGWAAMQEHEWDYDQLGMREVFARVLEQHLHVRVLAVGMDLGISSPRYEHVPWQAYDALPHQLARMDVALAPLADHPFNRTRSCVKLREYAAVGVPWLASPVGEAAELGEQQGGRLVADGDWRQQIEALVRDEPLRQRLGLAGRKWAAGEVVTEHVAALEAVLEQARALARAA
jgi:hypothetical protein